MSGAAPRTGVPTRHTHKWDGLVCRPSHPCVCRVGTPPASTNARKGLPLRARVKENQLVRQGSKN